MLALESAEVVEAAVALVAEALPEDEPVEDAVAEAEALLEEDSTCDVTFLLPQETDWQVAWPSASSGWSAVH